MIFFGSIDFVNALVYSRGLMIGQHIEIPYFPVVLPLLWFGGVVNAFTNLPLAFGYKIIPTIFDALIPLLLYDILTYKKYPFAFRAALMYALSPVAIIITVLHVQYDSVFAFFLLWSFYIRDFYKGSVKTFLLFGITFGFMFLIKPIGLIFMPLIIEPIINVKSMPKRYVWLNLWSVVGVVIVFLFAAVFFKAFHYDLVTQWTKISEYANHGVQIFGLPFASPFSNWKFLLSRNWIILCVLGVATLYHLRLIRQYLAILLIFAFVYATSGLCPQYLLWILPFLLVEGRIKLAGIYTILAGGLLSFYYVNPYISFYQFENLNTYVTFNRLAFLMPSARFYGHTVTSLLKIGLNYLIPLFGAFTFASILTGVLTKRIKKVKKLAIEDPLQVFSFEKDRMHLIYLIFAAGIWVLIGLIYIFLNSAQTLLRFDEHYQAKIGHYHFTSSAFPQMGIPYIGNYSQGGYLNIITFLFILSLGVGVYMLLPWKEKYKRRT